MTRPRAGENANSFGPMWRTYEADDAGVPATEHAKRNSPRSADATFDGSQKRGRMPPRSAMRTSYASDSSRSLTVQRTTDGIPCASKTTGWICASLSPT